MLRMLVALSLVVGTIMGCSHHQTPPAPPMAIEAKPDPWDLKPIESRPLNVQVLSTEEQTVDGVAIVKQELFYDSLDYQNQPVRIYGWYGFPKAASADEPIPAIVWSHGGGGRCAPREIDYFAAKGFAFLTIDLPGKGDGRTASRSTGPDMNGRNLEYGPLDDADLPNSYIYQSAIALMRGVTFLASRPEVDPQRIGAIGWSWGGLIVSVMNRHDTRLAAAVAGVPMVRRRPAPRPSTMPAPLLFGSDEDEYAEEEEIPDEPTLRMQGWFSRFNPTDIASGMHSPMFIVTGGNDNVDGQTELFNKLRVEKRIYIVPNGGHGAGSGPLWDQYTWYPQIVNWFNSQLKDDEPGMPQLDRISAQRWGDSLEISIRLKSKLADTDSIEVWYRSSFGERDPWKKLMANEYGPDFALAFREMNPIQFYVLLRNKNGAMVTSGLMRK